jgi:hypothetical protein
MNHVAITLFFLFLTFLVFIQFSFKIQVNISSKHLFPCRMMSSLPHMLMTAACKKVCSRRWEKGERGRQEAPPSPSFHEVDNFLRIASVEMIDTAVATGAFVCGTEGSGDNRPTSAAVILILMLHHGL